jgi:hypothetical protein
MCARISGERSNELQRRRLLRRTRTHNSVSVFIGEHREVLHRLHISPTGQRFPRVWDVDVPPSSLSASLEALTIAYQLLCVFDCSRTPYKGDGCNQRNQQHTRVSHRQLACRYFNRRAAFRSRKVNELRLLFKFSRLSCADTGKIWAAEPGTWPLSAFASPPVSRSPQARH